MISALGDFLALAFGVVTGTQLAAAVAGAPAYTTPVPLPGVAAAGALVIAAAGFVIRLRAHARDAPAIILVSIVGFAGTWAGGVVLGSDLGPFIGALLVGLGANAHARWWRRSPMVVMVPSIILLVPGAVGFRSFALLMREDVLGGVQTAYSMAMVGTALSTGLLLANLILTAEPPRAVWR